MILVFSRSGYTPPLIPGLLSVQNKEKVLKLGKAELLPLYLTGIILLKKEKCLPIAIQCNRIRINFFLFSPPPVGVFVSEKDFSPSCLFLFVYLELPGEQTSCLRPLQSSPKAPPAPMASLLPAAAAVSDETRTCFLEN